MSNYLMILGFGLLLGIRHAFEADHLIAVSTMIYELKSARRAALVGTFWGIGHTTTLFVIGLIVLLLRLSIPEYIAGKLELAVGLMLVILGINTIIKKSTQPHEHLHAHEGIEHTHVHTHQHRKSFLIGTVHGLAGSGALLILVLSLVKSVWEGIFYILTFGIGSTVGMTAMSFFLGIPLSKALSSFSKAEKILRLIMGVSSIVFGIFVIYSVTKGI